MEVTSNFSLFITMCYFCTYYKNDVIYGVTRLNTYDLKYHYVVSYQQVQNFPPTSTILG